MKQKTKDKVPFMAPGSLKGVHEFLTADARSGVGKLPYGVGEAGVTPSLVGPMDPKREKRAMRGEYTPQQPIFQRKDRKK